MPKTKTAHCLCALLLLSFAAGRAGAQAPASTAAPAQDPKPGFRRYPVRLYFFRDGLFVRGAAPEHARLAGARVLKIGNATAEDAYRAVLAVTPRDNETKSLSESLLDALDAGGAEAAVKLYRAYRADPTHRYLSTEGEVNTLGYRLLQSKRVGQAIAVFKLNVEDYPRSANVYDSLADAYEAAGQKELAIKSSEQVLATLPQDASDEGRKNGIRAGTLERLRRLKGTQ